MIHGNGTAAVELTAEELELAKDEDGVLALVQQHVDDTVQACAAAFGDYILLLERIHKMYANIQMDTDEDKELHSRVVEQADKVLALVKSRLGLKGEDDAGE